VSPDCAGQVVVSGSYGGEYNAWHAAKWGIRGVILSDAGVGKNNAGTKGLPYLDRVALPAATADANTCHIADGDDILAHGIISHVNAAAERIGVRVGQTVQQSADLMRAAPILAAELPEIAGGKRYLISANPGEPKVICLDAAPMLEPADAGAIAVTGSHAALFRGQSACFSATPVSARTTQASCGWPTWTSVAFRPARPRLPVRRLAIRETSTKMVSCRTSTTARPGLARPLA
jgi:hypothetical protein